MSGSYGSYGHGGSSQQFGSSGYNPSAAAGYAANSAPYGSYSSVPTTQQHSSSSFGTSGGSGSGGGYYLPASGGAIPKQSANQPYGSTNSPITANSAKPASSVKSGSSAHGSGGNFGGFYAESITQGATGAAAAAAGYLSAYKGISGGGSGGALAGGFASGGASKSGPGGGGFPSGHVINHQQVGGMRGGGGGGGGGNFRRFPAQLRGRGMNVGMGNTAPQHHPAMPRPQPPSKYCEICKIKAIGEEAFRSHIEGKQHKRREAQVKAGGVPPANKKAMYKCELCDVISSSEDAHNSHVRGIKHQRTLKMFQSMEKPIPSLEPTIIPPVVSEKSKREGVPDAPAVEVKPVGESYVEPIIDEKGNISEYNCKLCDCKFKDVLAKDIHMKGRKHRLQYKAKVDPSLVVELPKQKIAPGPKRLKREGFASGLRSELSRLREQELWNLRQRYEAEMQYLMSIRGPTVQQPMQHVPKSRGFNQFSTIHYDIDAERHAMAKHAEIYPTESELTAIQTTIADVEKALKGVSDFLVQQAIKADAVVDEKTKPAAEPDAKVKEESGADAGVKAVSPTAIAERAVKGVMRIGPLAKGLLLRGDTNVEIVVLCAEKPTVTLLKQIYGELPNQLKLASEDENYNVRLDEKNAKITATSSSDPKITVTIYLTSHDWQNDTTEDGVVKKEGESTAPKQEPKDLLSKQKCLDALALLQQAKWFQARLTGINSSLYVLRLLRDLALRESAFAVLSPWALELLVERALVGPGVFDLNVADSLKRVFETIASGILLPGGPGLLDPCEKKETDVIANLNGQQRETLTATAQRMLRELHFKKIHTILGIERLPPFVRKRPRELFAGKDGSTAASEKTEDTMETSEADATKAEGAAADAGGAEEEDSDSDSSEDDDEEEDEKKGTA